MRYLFLLFLPSLVLSSIVETPFGEVEGFEHVTEKGIPTHVFLGIRYGQAPDVHSRFKKPEMVEKWAPYRHSAKRFGAACVHTPIVGALPDKNYSEDCLFMNIITPKLYAEDLPVFMFIHGGGFQMGAADMFGYKRLAERVASEGIVVVTINYRLGPFGFFSLGDSVAPGNMGLWDQTLALHFLHEILPSFGGDSSRITVGGQSAGSCAASALQFSPHSSSLFTQSLLMSGSAITEWAVTEQVVDESRKLAAALGCLKESSVKTIDCMQERTAEEILEAKNLFFTEYLVFLINNLFQTSSGDFFPHSIERLANTAPRKRTLSGVTDLEGATFVTFLVMYPFTPMAVSASEWKHFSREKLIHFIETVVAPEDEHYDSASAFRRHLIEFYVEKDEKKGDYSFYLQRYTELISDLQFLIPLYHEIQIKLDNDWPTYLYILQHIHKSSPREDPVTG
ncbi:hypothetical protein PFISCL1PPCAC_22979, partial [Pristionchus fissidentatus]